MLVISDMAGEGHANVEDICPRVHEIVRAIC